MKNEENKEKDAALFIGGVPLFSWRGNRGDPEEKARGGDSVFRERNRGGKEERNREREKQRDLRKKKNTGGSPLPSKEPRGGTLWSPAFPKEKEMRARQ